MRMVMVVVVMLTSILAVTITGYMVVGITGSFMTYTPRTNSSSAIETYSNLDNLVTNAGLPWLIMLGGVVGLLIWGFLQAQNRETVTGAYY